MHLEHNCNARMEGKQDLEGFEGKRWLQWEIIIVIVT